MKIHKKNLRSSTTDRNTKVQKVKNGVWKKDTDIVACDVFYTLLRDFRRYFGPSFCDEAEVSFHKGIQSYRAYSYPSAFNTKPSFFKAQYQMQALLKKYRFANDLYSDTELEERSIAGYFQEQERLCMPRAPYKEYTFRVMQQARKICRGILGEFPKDMIPMLAKFGKMSSIGCPLSLAHLDIKLSKMKAFTGSRDVSVWFTREVLSKDEVLTRILRRCLLKPYEPFHFTEIESLALKDVPKSWKILRIITPLALLNLFYSHGYGELVTRGLANENLIISKLQEIHRNLVKDFSISDDHVTLDLSKASDSILKNHLNLLLQRDWYNGLKPILTHQITYSQKETKAYTASVLPMGNGATFPLETLFSIAS